MDKDSPLVVARVLLRSAAGERPGIDVPITAGTVGRLAPAPDTVAAVADHFLRAGFVVLGKPGITIGISGSKELFERHFGIELAQGADHAYTIRALQGSGRLIDPTLIPEDCLPPRIRQATSQIALEAAASMDQLGTDR
jgi:hypothetical protein